MFLDEKINFFHSTVWLLKAV